MMVPHSVIAHHQPEQKGGGQMVNQVVKSKKPVKPPKCKIMLV